MNVAIGLPNWIPGITGSLLVDWGRRAEEAGFSSVGTLGIIAGTGQEELVALGAVAAVTTRIGLATTVLASPARETVLLAKQAATLDAISGGRLTLGLGAGWRTADFAATGARFGARGSRLEQQIGLMRRVWSGAACSDELGFVSPAPSRQGGPALLLGGAAPIAIERAGRLADGFVAMPLAPARVEAMFAAVCVARRSAGRSGRPRFVAGAYFALGPPAADARDHLRHSYAALGPEVADRFAGAMLTEPDTIRSTLRAFAEIGVDEMFLWPAAASVDQVDRLAAAAL